MFSTIRVKCGLRFKLLAAFIVLLTITILALVLTDKCDTYDPLSYVLASISWLHRNELGQPKPIGSAVGDKIVVIPALVTDDMSWVAEELPDWQRAVYIVNPSNTTFAGEDGDSGSVSADLSTTQLTTPMNKGKESMAYLTYIIDNYNHHIPSTIAFLHSHRRGFFNAWHVDTPLHDNVMALQLLRLDTVSRHGYVNLRCNWNPGCTKRGRNNAHVTRDTWEGVMGNTSTPLFNSRAGRAGALPAGTEIWNEDDHNKITVWAPCCAQFAVSREVIHRRPLDDYVSMRQWLMETELDDARSGRVFEYLWHVIFGQEATFCPDRGDAIARFLGGVDLLLDGPRGRTTPDSFGVGWCSQTEGIGQARTSNEPNDTNKPSHIHSSEVHHISSASISSALSLMSS